MARVLVAEPKGPVGHALKTFFEGSGHSVTLVSLQSAVLAAAQQADLVLVALSTAFAGDELIAALKLAAPALPVVALLPPDDELAQPRALKAGADAVLVLPLKKATVLSLAGLLLRLAAQRAKLVALEGAHAALQARSVVLEGELKKQRQSLAAAGEQQSDAAFFKRYLLIELKRSKRYSYPVSVLLVALDNLEQVVGTAPSPELQRAAIRAEALGCLSQVLRDIDLFSPYGDDRYLVFLPHTPRPGAVTVAQRLHARFNALAAFAGGTASIGVATWDAKHSSRQAVSFGGLVREATVALKAARAAGGNRVDAGEAPPVKKRSRISMG
jgi:diguanylate cyclase (GGDEF)-like protein